MPRKSAETHELGDIVEKPSSAQDEYYRFKLLKEKMDAAGENAAEVKKVLGARSERDEIELEILKNLADITESSPEFAQIVDITGSRDRFEQARRLAEAVYDKMRAEQVLALYTPPKSELRGKFADRAERTAKKRAEAVGRFAADAAKKKSLAGQVASAAGAGEVRR